MDSAAPILARGVRYLAAAVLVVAAIAKAWAGPVEGWGVALHLLLITCEGGLALLLITNAAGRWTLRVGAAVFFAFAAVAAGKFFAGEASCGCFGKASVPPWVTAIADLLLASAFALAARGAGRESGVPGPWRIRVFAVGALLLALGFGAALAQSFRVERALRAIGDVQGGVVYMQPDQWVGSAFPLIPVVEQGQAFSHGRWIVLIHQAGCGLCEAALPDYRQFAEAQPSEGVRFATIAMNSAGESQPHPNVLQTQLPSSQQWFATTPIVACVVDGKVIYANSGSAAVDPDEAMKAMRSAR